MRGWIVLDEWRDFSPLIQSSCTISKGFPKRLRKELSIISNQRNSVMEMASDEGDLDMEPERITQ